MKKLILVILPVSLIGCTNQAVARYDTYGCNVAEGYRWSVLQQACSPVYKSAMVFDPLNGVISPGSGYVIFDHNQNKAEFFRHHDDDPHSQLLSKQDSHWQGNDISLHKTEKGYEVRHNNVTTYQSRQPK